MLLNRKLLEYRPFGSDQWGAEGGYSCTPESLTVSDAPLGKDLTFETHGFAVDTIPGWRCVCVCGVGGHTSRALHPSPFFMASECQRYGSMHKVRANST